MVEEDEEDAHYDDITKYDEASAASGDENSGLVTDEPKSTHDPSDKYTPGKLSDNTTAFAMPAPNGYDSFTNTEQTVKETASEENSNDNKPPKEAAGDIP